MQRVRLKSIKTVGMPFVGRSTDTNYGYPRIKDVFEIHEADLVNREGVKDARIETVSDKIALTYPRSASKASGTAKSESD